LSSMVSCTNIDNWVYGLWYFETVAYVQTICRCLQTWICGGVYIFQITWL